MAYFANSTAADLFQERQCDCCDHWRRDAGGWNCPVWEVHLMVKRTEQTAQVLDRLIPLGFPEQIECSMFVPLRETESPTGVAVRELREDELAPTPTAPAQGRLF